jgi:hypothetical protein
MLLYSSPQVTHSLRLKRRLPLLAMEVNFEFTFNSLLRASPATKRTSDSSSLQDARRVSTPIARSLGNS